MGLSDNAKKNKREYTAKWTRENTYTFSFRLTKHIDGDLIDFIKKIPNKNAYIKSLLKEELKKSIDK